MNASRHHTPDDERPLLEPIPGPVTRDRVERRWFGLPARFVLLCLACASLGATVGLLASGNFGWGVVTLLLAILFAAALSEAARQRGRLWPEQSGRLAADGRAHATTTAEVWRTRLDTGLARWRTRSRLDEIELERRPALQALGEAVYTGDAVGEREARRRLEKIDERRRLAEEELLERLSGAEERIRLARLPVQETIMVAPNEPPNPPYPPPDEGQPPQPAVIPEPYPPPDEGDPPLPAPEPEK